MRLFGSSEPSEKSFNSGLCQVSQLGGSTLAEKPGIKHAATWESPTQMMMAAPWIPAYSRNAPNRCPANMQESTAMP